MRAFPLPQPPELRRAVVHLAPALFALKLVIFPQAERSSPLRPPTPIPPCTNLGATTPVYTVPQPRVASCQSELRSSSGGGIKRRGKEESRRTSALIKNVWGGKERGERGRERWR